ncbi:hypothetical protein LguiA_023931 [Lonicera macranthoides]
MDPDPPPTRSSRKVRFAPKGPPRRKAKPTPPKAEKADDNLDQEAEQANLLRRATEHLAGRGPKVEKKSSVQVAFAHGAATSTSIRTFGKPREGNGGDKSKDFGSTDSARDNSRQIVISSSPSTATTEGTSGSSVNAVNASSQKIKKDYIEPYDYENTYYPITLPLRRPYSGDPELCDAEEFGEAGEDVYNENAINAAEELGLLEESEEPRMLFLQLPTCGNRADGKNMSGSQIPLGGHIGKMLVYKSGAVKWKIGEALYDVSAGSNPKCPQDVVAINSVNKDCSMLGELGQRAVVTPEIDFLLDGGIDLK